MDLISLIGSILDTLGSLNPFSWIRSRDDPREFILQWREAGFIRQTSFVVAFVLYAILGLGGLVMVFELLTK
jgi:hypothetical protein